MDRASRRSSGGRSRRLNAIVALAIAVVAVASLVALRMHGSSEKPGLARVTDGDGNVYEMPLGDDATKIVTTELGTNVVEVRDGRVRVREADCPNRDCVNQGWIDSSSQQIVCLPHRLYVEVVDGQGSGVDVVGR